MKKLFWGFLLMFLSFDLELNGHSLDVLPDFVGYILLLRGIDELNEESSLFKGARPYAIAMAIYSAILWVGELLAITSGDSMIASFIDLMAMIVALYIAWVLIQGVMEIESNCGADLHTVGLYKWWKGLVAIQVTAKLLSLLANLANLSIILGLVTVVALVGLVLNILYLVAWWKSAKAYENLPESAEME